MNTNQVFGWRKRYASDQGAVDQINAPALVPVTIVEQTGPQLSGSDDRPTAIMELTVGRAKLRVEGQVDPGLLAQVLDRLLR